MFHHRSYGWFDLWFYHGLHDIAKEQRNEFGSSDLATEKIRKRGRVTGHPSALVSPATLVLVLGVGGKELRNQGAAIIGRLIAG